MSFLFFCNFILHTFLVIYCTYNEICEHEKEMLERTKNLKFELYFGLSLEAKSNMDMNFILLIFLGVEAFLYNIMAEKKF